MLVCGRHPHSLHCAGKKLQESTENKSETENYTSLYFTAEKRKDSINLVFIVSLYLRLNCSPWATPVKSQVI